MRKEVDVTCERCGETYTVSVSETSYLDYVCFCGNYAKISPWCMWDKQNKSNVDKIDG